MLASSLKNPSKHIPETICKGDLAYFTTTVRGKSRGPFLPRKSSAGERYFYAPKRPNVDFVSSTRSPPIQPCRYWGHVTAAQCYAGDTGGASRPSQGPHLQRATIEDHKSKGRSNNFVGLDLDKIISSHSSHSSRREASRSDHPHTTSILGSWPEWYRNDLPHERTALVSCSCTLHCAVPRGSDTSQVHSVARGGSVHIADCLLNSILVIVSTVDAYALLVEQTKRQQRTSKAYS